MKLKIAGKLNAPPPQAEFDRIPLGKLCRNVSGTFCRIHATNPATGKPWEPMHFSLRDATRFDPAGGLGTWCIARTFGGALMEVFDDRWGAVGTYGRSLTQKELQEWWVTMVSLPSVFVFNATGANLSKLGTDAQLLSGGYDVSREWALRLMQHPLKIGGILFPSRHDTTRSNLALFKRPGLSSGHFDASLTTAAARSWKREAAQRGRIIYGPPVLLADHPVLPGELKSLEVALLP